MGVILNVVNFEGKVYHSRLDQEGRVSFASTFDGEHRICLRLNQPSCATCNRNLLLWRAVRLGLACRVVGACVLCGLGLRASERLRRPVLTVGATAVWRDTR